MSGGARSGEGRASSADEAQRATYAFTGAFFAALGEAGVVDVCVCPGSRSTPLAVVAGRTPGLVCWSHVDERSAGFFALGLSLASRRPVAVICTSGSAAANLLPAVVEAFHAGVPLLVLTADRPPELRSWGAGQTIDQISLYGTHVRRFVELPVPVSGAAARRHARHEAARAVCEARSPRPGPVHLNWPLREPLEPPSREIRDEEDARACGVELASAARAPCEADVALLCSWIEAHREGVILPGPMCGDEALARAIGELGRLAGWPILADATSQLRSGAHCTAAPVLAHGDLLLREPRFASAHRPAVALRLGASPVSKAQRLWLEAAPPERLVLVSDGGAWNDPGHLATRMVQADAALLSRALCARLGAPRQSRWLAEFVEADRRIAAALDRALDDEDGLYEPRCARELVALLPDGASLFVSNSMPVRNLDAFMPLSERRLAVYCNRGANGIDGVVSSALGVAASGAGPVALLIGDLALLHDLGGLLAARRHDLDLTVVVLDNDGGGIFSFLPIAEHGDDVRFEELFRTPHGLDLSHASALFGAHHTRVADWAGFRDAVRRSLESGGLSLIEVPIDRDANLKHWRELVATAGRAASPAE